jgi:hypothetical protein
MSERSVVENRNVGARWFISLEKELREETGAKYPDKTVVHCSLEGFEADYESARRSLLDAKVELEKLVAEAEKRKERDGVA